MSAMTNLLVKDDASTPVEYTFAPVTDTPNPLWRTIMGGVPLLGQMRLQFTADALKSGDTKLSIKTEVPVMETLGASGTASGYIAPPKVAYTMVCITTLFAPARSTNMDRANAIKIHLGVLQGASSSTGSGTLNQAVAGNGFVNSTLPALDFFVKALKPN